MTEQRIERVFRPHKRALERVSYPENDYLYPNMSLQTRIEEFPDVLRDHETGEIVVERKYRYDEISHMPMNIRVEMFGSADINLLARDMPLITVPTGKWRVLPPRPSLARRSA